MDGIRSGVTDNEQRLRSNSAYSSKRDPRSREIVKIGDDHRIVRLVTRMLPALVRQAPIDAQQLVADRSELWRLERLVRVVADHVLRTRSNEVRAHRLL